MTCKHCAKEFRDDFSWCPHCGMAVIQPEEAENCDTDRDVRQRKYLVTIPGVPEVQVLEHVYGQHDSGRAGVDVREESMICEYCGKEFRGDLLSWCPHCGMAVIQPVEAENREADRVIKREKYIYILLIITGVIISLPLYPMLEGDPVFTGIMIFLVHFMCIFIAAWNMRSVKKSIKLPLMRRGATFYSKGQDDSSYHATFVSPDKETLQLSFTDGKIYAALEEGKYVILYKGARLIGFERAPKFGHRRM